jgi:protein-disulfide isomerase
VCGPAQVLAQRGTTASAPAAAAPSSISLAGAPARGTADSKATLVMFTDFGNPACGSAGVILRGLLEIYPEQLRIVFKHNLPPNQPDRLLVHEAARAAEAQGKFWEMHDLLLQNQRTQSRTDLIGIASQLQLDDARFVSDLDSGRYREAIEADRGEARTLGIRNQQPTWFLNGRRIDGPVTLAALRGEIDAALR